MGTAQVFPTVLLIQTTQERLHEGKEITNYLCIRNYDLMQRQITTSGSLWK